MYYAVNDYCESKFVHWPGRYLVRHFYGNFIELFNHCSENGRICGVENGANNNTISLARDTRGKGLNGLLLRISTRPIKLKTFHCSVFRKMSRAFFIIKPRSGKRFYRGIYYVFNARPFIAQCNTCFYHNVLYL